MMKSAFACIAALICAYWATVPAEAAIVRWEGTATLTDSSLGSPRPAGSVGGYFDFDTATGTIIDVALTYDTTGAVDPDFQGFTADTVSTLGLNAFFVSRSFGPDFTGDPLIAAGAPNDNFGEVGAVLEFLTLRSCANAACTASRGAGMGNPSIDFSSRLLTPIPLPAGGLLLASGLLALGFLRRRRAPAVV